MRLDRTLIVLALLLGGFLRLHALAREPLGADEAAHAWRATRAASAGEVSSDDLTAPSLASAQAALFVLVAPDTLLARLPAALCGLALLLVPLLAGRVLGPVRTSALVILLAIDPTLVRISRDAAGASAALLAASLALASLLRWREDGRTDAVRGRAWAVAVSAAVGASIASGPHAWSLLLLVGLAAWSLRPWRACAPRAGECAAAFAAAALLASTAGLWALPWAAGISASLTAWLARLASPWQWGGLLELLRTSPLVILLALVGLTRARRGPAVLALAAALWLALRTPEASAPLALVLVLCAAQGAGALAAGDARLRWIGAFAAAGAVALAVQVGGAARPAAAERRAGEAPDLETLASDLERIAVLKGREAHELPVRVLGERPDPAVGWALRRVRRVWFQPTRVGDEGALPAPLVAPAPDPPAPLPGYVGSTYASPRGKVNLWVPIEP